MTNFRIIILLIAAGTTLNALGQTSVQKDTLALKVIGTWNLEKISVNGNEDSIDHAMVNGSIVFNYDQTYVLSDHTNDYEEKGTWGINIDHQKIVMVAEKNNNISSFKIISIKEDSLVLQPLIIGVNDEDILYFKKKK